MFDTILIQACFQEAAGRQASSRMVALIFFKKKLGTFHYHLSGKRLQSVCRNKTDDQVIAI